MRDNVSRIASVLLSTKILERFWKQTYFGGYTSLSTCAVLL